MNQILDPTLAAVNNNVTSPIRGNLKYGVGGRLAGCLWFFCVFYSILNNQFLFFYLRKKTSDER